MVQVMILKKFSLNLNYNIIFSCHVVDYRCYTINKVTIYYVVYKSIVENILNILNKCYAIYIIIALITHLFYITEDGHCDNNSSYNYYNVNFQFKMHLCDKKNEQSEHKLQHKTF